MSPGELDVVQANRPYLLDFPRHFSQYIQCSPYRATSRQPRQPDGGKARPRSLARDLLDPDIEPDGICDEVTARAIQELLCGCSREQGLSRQTPDLYGKAIAIVRDKLFEPLLGRDRVAQELGVSVRTLARAFAMHGTTFDRWIWNCRLEAAYEALLSSRVGASITEVAVRHGF